MQQQNDVHHIANEGILCCMGISKFQNWGPTWSKHLIKILPKNYVTTHITTLFAFACEKPELHAIIHNAYSWFQDDQRRWELFLCPTQQLGVGEPLSFLQAAELAMEATYLYLILYLWELDAPENTQNGWFSTNTTSVKAMLLIFKIIYSKEILCYIC